MPIKKIPFIIKLLLIQLIFILLHYLYDWFPGTFMSIFSGTNESVYQHMKIGFFSYLIFALVEYLLTRKSISSVSQFVYTRLFSAVYFPLAIMLIYLFCPLVLGHVTSMLIEIIFANLALLATSFTTLVVEEHVQKAEISPRFRVVILLLFALSLAQFITFTFKLPWFDIFAVPPGW